MRKHDHKNPGEFQLSLVGNEMTDLSILYLNFNKVLNFINYS